MLKLGDKVITNEHSRGTIGVVTYLHANGDANIEFTTPPSDALPYGVINNEFWSKVEQEGLVLCES